MLQPMRYVIRMNTSLSLLIRGLNAAGTSRKGKWIRSFRKHSSGVKLPPQTLSKDPVGIRATFVGCYAKRLGSWIRASSYVFSPRFGGYIGLLAWIDHFICRKAKKLLVCVRVITITLLHSPGTKFTYFSGNSAIPSNKIGLHCNSE